MPQKEQPNALELTPEQQRQQEIADKEKAKINKAAPETVASQFNKNNTLAPTDADIKKEVWKQTDLVKDRFPNLNTPRMTTILRQYKVITNEYEIKTIGLKDIYKLPATTKANLSYLSTITNISDKDIENVSQSTYMKEHKLDSAQIKAKMDSFTHGSILTSEDIEFSKALRNELNNIKQQEILQVFENMFSTGQDIPIMPDIIQLAVGDGKSTMGLGGENNGSRWLFEYNNNTDTKQFNSNSRNLEFGLTKNKPMSISIIPSGVSSKLVPSTITLSIKDKQGKEIGPIIGSYIRKPGGNGNIFELTNPNKLPNISIVDNTISLPPEYQNTTISITSKAGYLGNGNYDEANFSLSIENGMTVDPNQITVGGTTSVYEMKAIGGMQLGKYELIDKEKKEIKGVVDKSLFFGKKILKDHITMNLKIGVDKTKFTTTSINNTVAQYDTYIESNKNLLVNTLQIFTNDQWNSMMNTLDPNWETNPTQYTAQKKLLACRCITAINQMIQNKDMIQAIKTGKFDIVTSSASDGKYTSLIPEPMNYPKT